MLKSQDKIRERHLGSDGDRKEESDLVVSINRYIEEVEGIGYKV